MLLKCSGVGFWEDGALALHPHPGTYSCPDTVRAALGRLRRLHPQWDSKSLKGVHVGSKMGDCGKSVWAEPAALGDTQGEGKGRLSPLRACSNDRGCRLRRGSAQAGLRSDLPTWTGEPRGLLPLRATSGKGDLRLPTEGKTPTRPPIRRKDQRDPQKGWKPARYQLERAEKSHKPLDGNITAQAEGKEAKLENHNKPLPWRWS